MSMSMSTQHSMTKIPSHEACCVAVNVKPWLCVHSRPVISKTTHIR